ncbi:MAG: two-component regulator propeller domain-containing protein [Bacteroidota bacterium]
MKRKFKIPQRLLFIATGIIATIWFLIRVIPKPSRAAYPCMRIAAPVMSGFIVYLLSLGGITLFIRKARKNFLRADYMSAGALVLAALAVSTLQVIQHTQDSAASELTVAGTGGPDDGPNQPMGTGNGVHPGRVVWVWDPKATNADCINVFELFKPENTNQGVVNRMVVDGVKNLGGKSSLAESWDVIFRAFNYKKSKRGSGYTKGEKIFIKVNQTTANGMIRRVTPTSGFDIPKRLLESQGAKEGKYGTCETFPNVTLEILRELVYVVGVDQKDIAIGDPIAHLYNYNYETWATEFPDVVYVDKMSDLYGRTLIHPTEDDLIFYSDKTQSDKLYDIIENADYLINVANLKPHGRAGISLTAKNHYGSHARRSAFHLHYSLISPFSMGKPTNNGYGKYRALVDIMGSKYLGQNTLLYVVDGLYGGGSVETGVPVKYFMPPFNNDWSSSIFLSQDQVALESVCYDFLRSEWNGTYSHNPANNSYEDMVNVNGVDDYLHQAADPANWPEGIIYDPDNSGQPLASLGTHEHWNNAARKQYSRNLGIPQGIELISVPDTLIGGAGPEVTTSASWLKETPVLETVEIKTKTESGEEDSERKYIQYLVKKTFDESITARNFYSLVVDDDNVKWFLTEAGIVSYDDSEWKVNTDNRQIPVSDLKGVAYDSSEFGQELWLASPMGATVASIPVDARSGATTYYAENSDILSENVVSVAVGKGSFRWFGTDKGISAFVSDKWLKPAYERKYPESMFKDFPITSMAASPGGDSLYVATAGAGVARVYRNDVDAISGASEYAQWGPIQLPSDHVNTIFIDRDGTQWFGTDAGVARHTGNVTMENWVALTEDDGLVDNFVQAIAVDYRERVWIGTKEGVTVFYKNSLTSITEEDGLASNNVLSIAVDHQGVVWFGTDSGVCSYWRGELTTYTH